MYVIFFGLFPAEFETSPLAQLDPLTEFHPFGRVSLSQNIWKCKRDCLLPSGKGYAVLGLSLPLLVCSIRQIVLYTA